MNWDEETFYNSIRNGVLKFQKILNEEWEILSLFLIILSLIFIKKWAYFKQYYTLVEVLLGGKRQIRGFKELFETYGQS